MTQGPDEAACIRTLAVALFWRIRDDNACPEVGMGPDKMALLNEVLRQANLSISHDSKRRVLAMAKTIRP